MPALPLRHSARRPGWPSCAPTGSRCRCSCWRCSGWVRLRFRSIRPRSWRTGATSWLTREPAACARRASSPNAPRRRWARVSCFPSRDLLTLPELRWRAGAGRRFGRRARGGALHLRHHRQSEGCGAAAAKCDRQRPEHGREFQAGADTPARGASALPRARLRIRIDDCAVDGRAPGLHRALGTVQLGRR